MNLDGQTTIRALRTSTGATNDNDITSYSLCLKGHNVCYEQLQLASFFSITHPKSTLKWFSNPQSLLVRSDLL